MAIGTDGRSISDVLRDIVQNIQDIVRAEMRLAKSEISKEIIEAKAAGILLGLGAASGFLAVLFALVAIVFALSNVIANWAAALVVAVSTGIVAASLVYAGRNRLRNVHPIPERTVETVKDNFQWTKPQTK
jgi:VIT1/CCC1 family predicted Fe2+/Mn2+ transporter